MNNSMVGSVISFLMEGTIGSGTFYMGRLVNYDDKTNVSVVHCPVGVQVMSDGVIALGEVMPLVADGMVTFSNLLAVAKPVMPLTHLYEAYVEKIHPMCDAALLKDVSKSYDLLLNAGKDELEHIRNQFDEQESSVAEEDESITSFKGKPKRTLN